MTVGTDRVLGMVALVGAIAVVLEARTFTVAFYTDPLGARGLPFIAAALVGVGSLLLIARPRGTVRWPARENLARAAIAGLVLVAYAIVLHTIGFLLATTTAVAVISIVFGGPRRKSVVLATVYTLLLYGLFFYLLGMRLPIGTIFIRGT